MGSSPTSAKAIISANGLKCFCLTCSSFAKMTAAAPSLIPDAFPAVTVPA